MEHIIINGAEIEHYEKTDSTNNIAKSHNSPRHLLTVVSDRQEMGRGRVGRSFYSELGGLYMSVILSPEKCLCSLPFCTCAASLAVYDVITELENNRYRIKWVNDIINEKNKKVCGILTEAKTENNKIERVIVGIGINLLPPEDGFPEEIKDIADSIGYRGDKLCLAAKIAHRLDYYIKRPSAELVKAYRERLAFVGEEISFTDYANSREKSKGIMLGVDNSCSLIVKTKDGVRHISSGEIGR